MTALYLRLSREDGDKEVSESIENQKMFLTAYAHERGFQDCAVYADDGYSGTTFDRPDWKRLIADIERGGIETVITKDLSRLGRDYIETGRYLERFFPAHNIRYIAVTDNMDSDDGMSDLTPIRSVFNDYYARDISKKVRSALLGKKKSGAFIGSVAPYGYKKDPLNKNHLIIDEMTAPYVRRVFALFLSGMSIHAIAAQLTEEGVPTPSGSKKLAATQRRFPGLWNDRILRRILENPVYIGHMAQNKTEKKNYKLERRTVLPKDKWIVVENTHEAVVRREDFEAAQRRLAVRRYCSGRRGGESTERLLTGLVFCADCGASMSVIREAPERVYLVCRTWRSRARLKLCTSHCIREDLVTGAVSEQLRLLGLRFVDKDALADACAAIPVADGQRSITALEKRLKDKQTVKLSLYKDKAAGIIGEADYLAFSEIIGREETALEKQLKKLRGRACVDDMRAEVESLLSFEHIDRGLLLRLVKRIEIGEDKHIKIEFAFSEPG